MNERNDVVTEAPIPQSEQTSQVEEVCGTQPSGRRKRSFAEQDAVHNKRSTGGLDSLGKGNLP